MHKEQAKLVNAQSHLYKGTRQNSYEICAQTYTIKLLNFSLFMWFWIFTHTKLKHKSKIKIETMHKKKCKMHKMHEDMTCNA